MTVKPIISVQNVTKRFGRFTALDNVSIDVMPGEIFAILGPSGCGKSTLLRIIAGLEAPTEGCILLDDADITAMPANKRPINMVFQSYAVFPQMSVAKNVAYGLKVQRMPRSQIDQAVAQALAQVHLTEFRDRMPNQLSGGQRQRVALARALVKRPRVLLLDEPLSALDAKLRDAMRLELVHLQEQVGVSFVIVTHDQSEAMAIADRIAVLNDGRLCQVDSPEGLYQRPVDGFVADFIGRINFFEIKALKCDSGKVIVSSTKAGDVVIAASQAPDGIATDGLVMAIRPEKITVSLTAPITDGGTVVQGTLGDIAFQGESSIVEINLPCGAALSAFLHDSDCAPLRQAAAGANVWCHWKSGDVLVLARSAV